MTAALAERTGTCWDVALTRRGGLSEWVTVHADTVGDAQVAALMLGLRRDPAAFWSAGTVRPSLATVQGAARAPRYGSQLGRRLEQALRTGAVRVDEATFDPELGPPWYTMAG